MPCFVLRRARNLDDRPRGAFWRLKWSFILHGHFRGAYHVMPGESSNLDCVPPTQPAQTRGPAESEIPPNLDPTTAAPLAVTEFGPSPSMRVSDGSAPESPGGEPGTVALPPLTAAGWSPSRSHGRFTTFPGRIRAARGDRAGRNGCGLSGRRQEKLNRLVAVKLIRSGSLAGDDDLRRFRHEAEAIADLDHPNIIPIYEIGQEDDQPYFSMKLIEGGNLTRHIPRLKDDPRGGGLDRQGRPRRPLCSSADDPAPGYQTVEYPVGRAR